MSGIHGSDLAIQINGLRKAFGELEVLRGVDLEVERGSIVALLGSNGAGKTTLVNILSTLRSADCGSALVNGLDVATHGAEVRPVISLTGQFAAVDEILTATLPSLPWETTCLSAGSSHGRSTQTKPRDCGISPRK